MKHTAVKESYNEAMALHGLRLHPRRRCATGSLPGLWGWPGILDELKETVAVPNEIREEAKQALFEIPCGLFVVTSFSNTATPKYNGMINNTVFQITDQPQQVVLGINKSHLTTEYIQESQSFVINFLTPPQLSLVKLYGYKSGRQVDKFAEIPWHPGITGAPILDAATGYLECSVIPSKTG